MSRRSRSYKIGLYEQLQDDSEMLMYLQAAAEDSASIFLIALRDVAEARGITKLAEQSKLNRENLYRILGEDGNPRLNSLVALLEALGLRLGVEKIATPEAEQHVVNDRTQGMTIEIENAAICFAAPANEGTEFHLTSVDAKDNASTPTWIDPKHPMYRTDRRDNVLEFCA